MSCHRKDCSSALGLARNRTTRFDHWVGQCWRRFHFALLLTIRTLQNDLRSPGLSPAGSFSPGAM
jgi:hypothetical protein